MKIRAHIYITIFWPHPSCARRTFFYTISGMTCASLLSYGGLECRNICFLRTVCVCTCTHAHHSIFLCSSYYIYKIILYIMSSSAKHQRTYAMEMNGKMDGDGEQERKFWCAARIIAIQTKKLAQQKWWKIIDSKLRIWENSGENSECALLLICRVACTVAMNSQMRIGQVMRCDESLIEDSRKVKKKRTESCLGMFGWWWCV